MGVYHGKKAKVYAWDGTSTAHTSEACTEGTTDAQITDTAKRILDPNEVQTFTDSGGKNVINIDYTIGKAYFDGTVATVTATGKHVLAANIDLIGNLFEWTVETSVDMADASVFGSEWKAFEGGMVKWTGGAEGYILNSTWHDAQTTTIKAWLVQLYLDASDHFMGWCFISGLSRTANINEVIRESITFDGFKHLTYVT